MNKSKYDASVARFGFLMGSSFLLFFGINLSLVAFLALLFAVLGNSESGFFRFHYLKTTVGFFVLGALLSSFNNLWRGNYELFWYSMEVLPNYLYWTLIVFVFITIGDKVRLGYDAVFGGITLGLAAVALYYVAFSQYGDDRFLKAFPANVFSFLLISFVPYAVYWLKQRSAFAAALILLALVFQQAFDGRRAGFVLVLAGGSLAFFVSLLQVGKVNRLMRLAAVVGVVLLVLQLPAVKTSLQQRSDRIASLLYEDTDSLSTERSYLTRMAMLEKGMNLWRSSMIFGVGLNNFTKIEGHIDGNFEGAELVINKNIRVVTSSHNSYLNLLAEGGLALIVPFGVLMFLLLTGAVRNWSRMEDPDKVIVISFCAMSIHMAFINAIINSVAWFNIGMMAYMVASVRRLHQPAKVVARPRVGQQSAPVTEAVSEKPVAGRLRPHWG